LWARGTLEGCILLPTSEYDGMVFAVAAMRAVATIISETRTRVKRVVE